MADYKPPQSARAEIGRRPSDLPSSPRRPAAPAGTRADAPEGKRLTVGREICLNGEITACDVLVVEGTVDATLSDSRLIEITDGGIFRGKAEIDNAEIGGLFDGNLVVRDRLMIRATGRVSGMVRYGRLEIECGGELIGDIQVYTKPVEPAAMTQPSAPVAGTGSSSAPVAGTGSYGTAPMPAMAGGSINDGSETAG